MTVAKRLIPALDVAAGQVVKGVNFLNIQAVGDPVTLAKNYQDAGADELVFLDITATAEERGIMRDVIAQVAKEVFIPLTVGGGLKTLDDIQAMFRAGADKIFLNSAAVATPELVNAAAQRYGNQAIVGAIDARWQPETQSYHVMTVGGRHDTGQDVIAWAKELVARGAGELLVTSMGADGTTQGYDLALYQALTDAVNVPVIASGGAGKVSDFTTLFHETRVDAALAASVFHYGTLAIPDVKHALAKKGVPIRVTT